MTTGVRARPIPEMMKYLVLVLFLACVAGLEVLHELRSGNAPGAAVCTASYAREDAGDQTLLLHLQSHR